MKEIIKEAFKKMVKGKITEARMTNHSIERLENRVLKFEEDEDITPELCDRIMYTLEKIKSFKFDNQSCAIQLASFVPIKQSYLYYSPDGRRGYYSIANDDMLSDSTGDQFWIIVRDRNITTFMLRKQIQTQNPQENKMKMRVDQVIYNFNDFLKKQTQPAA